MRGVSIRLSTVDLNCPLYGACQVGDDPVLSDKSTKRVDITELADIAPSPRRVSTKEGFHAVARSSPPVQVHSSPGLARARRYGGGARAGLLLPPPGPGPAS